MTRLMRTLLGLCLLLGPALAVHAGGGEFRVRYADTRLEHGVYLLDAGVDLHFSDKALEALENGVPLTIRYDIEVGRVRPYLWNERIASVTQRVRLRYHALSSRYLVTNLNTGVSKPYRSLEDAVQILGQLRGFPLVDHGLLRHGESYQVVLRARLDIEALPAPLRPLAYLSSKWRLSTGRYTWPLRR